MDTLDLDYPYILRSPTLPAPGLAALPHAILQKHNGQRSHVKSNKSSGFLYDLNGQRFYSPNCKRPGVNLPPPLCEPNNGILQGRDYQFADLCQPQWWTKAHGYFAFTPLYPSVSTPPFHPLMHLPKVVYDFERKIPIPQAQVWSTWRLLQSKIVHAVHLLLFSSGAAAVRPAYPCARIDNKVESGNIRRAELKKDIFTAFSWFSIWFGCLAYAIAASKAMSQEACNLKIRSIPKWVEILLQVSGPRKDPNCDQDSSRITKTEDFEPLDEAFVSDLENSCVGRFDDSVERVGTFVTIPADDKEETISIDWLVACHVPVWYAWGPREEEISRQNPFWQQYAPPLDAELVTSWGSRPEGHESITSTSALPQTDTSSSSNKLAQVATPSSPNPLAQVDDPPLSTGPASGRSSKRNLVRRELEPHEKTWEDFFQRRAGHHADVLAKESLQDRAKRENRERCPPTNAHRTRFYEWVRDEKGVFVRQKIEGEDWGDLFDEEGRYGKQQAKYDPVFNEWDLCEYFGPPDDDQLVFQAETDAEYYGCSISDSLSRLYTYWGLEEQGQEGEKCANGSGQGDMLNCGQTLSPQLMNADGASSDSLHDSYPHPLPPQEREVPAMAYRLFGYVPPMGSSDRGTSSSSLSSNMVIGGWIPKALGISKHVPAKDPFWLTPVGQAVVKFLQSLAQARGTTSSDSWDLFVDNRMPVASLPRFKLLRRSMVDVPVQINEWDNIHGLCSYLADEPRQAFWFAGDRGQKWLVGCTSASVALLICRLDQSLVDPISIARYLVGQGIQFNTWEVTPTTPEPFVRKTRRLSKFRREHYRFTKDDYESYLLTRRSLLRGSGSACRAALMRGGIIWRLALEDVSIDNVFIGPSTHALEGSGITRGNGQGAFLVDDELNLDELECVCGFYETFLSCDNERSTAEQRGRLYWWPPADLWEHSNGVCGWTTDAESYYQERLAEIHHNYKPLPRSEWRKRLTKSSQVSRLTSVVEKHSQEYIIRFADTAGSHADSSDFGFR